MGNFESIGDNCEFGFVQRAYGCEIGGLLRWGLLDSPALIHGLRTRFEGIFEFENLSPAGGGTMVFDSRTGIAFHTPITSVEQGGRLVFDQSEEVRRAIHAEERGKIVYLRDKFFATLSEGRKILVFKQNRTVPRELALEISAAVAEHGTCSLLYVDPGQEGEEVGVVAQIAERVYRGVIDRFAPYDKANEISLPVWTDICRNAAMLHGVEVPAQG